MVQGRIQEFEKGGGGDSDTFFSGAPSTSGGGGGGVGSNRGIAGRNQTPFFFFRFHKGGHMYKKGGHL